MQGSGNQGFEIERERRMEGRMGFVISAPGQSVVGTAPRGVQKAGTCAVRAAARGATASRSKSRLQMVETPVNAGVVGRISISGNNIDLTDSLTEYVKSKVGRSIGKYDQMVIRADVHLLVAKNPAIRNGHSAEVVVQVKGNVIRAETKSENMYASIDAVTDKLTRTLRKYKERRNSHDGPHTADVALGEESDADEYVDDFVMWEHQEGAQKALHMVEREVIPLPKMTVQEAVTVLAFQTNFHVFREVSSNKICVIFKKEGGGIGLVEPEQ
ncbi:Ribosome hibernation promotion factor [Porphyridium purpureum]|uniref:Ribosome hibernation promotion factor n=1 Tax=Porphyridium purpureum TaxID=35688 RepID=A0A5J4Z013_PORPP|nr:Ribosome hibernation promotion factor [Porphyridium purpureum]|eukprot:POR9605..scf208_2